MRISISDGSQICTIPRWGVPHVIRFHAAAGLVLMALLSLAVFLAPVAAVRWLPLSNVHHFGKFERSPKVFARSKRQVPRWQRHPFVSFRGGAKGQNHLSSNDETVHDRNDEERYSRQVYTLGARAHGLVRSSCVIADGPLESGLLWESLKNLALSGIGKIVILIDSATDEASYEVDKAYHDANLDDLGKMYIRGARAEIEGPSGSESTQTPLEKLLVEFLYRLNPSLQVTTMTKSEFKDSCTQHRVGNEESYKSIFLCVDRPHDRQEVWNDLCRSSVDPSSSFPFVSVETAGVYGKVFCDFGPSHEIFDEDGESPLVVPLDRVELLESSGESPADIVLVKIVDGERHDVSKGDVIVFQRSDGSFFNDEICRVAKVLSPQRIHVQIEPNLEGSSNPPLDEFSNRINSQAVSFSRQKQVKTVQFLPLRDAMKQCEHLMTPSDLDKSFDMTRRGAIFECFHEMNDFVKHQGQLPTSLVGIDQQNKSDQHEKQVRNFFATCRAKFVPLQAVFGAIASQECLKAASGLYNPIHQFLLYDCDEILDPTSDFEILDAAKSLDQSSLAYIVGEEVEQKLQNQRVFVVGAGAIGCEILKNLAAMGAGTGKAGVVIVTDMDTIEKSNLSRQLLFRDSDIGKFKSKAAQEAMQRLNPAVSIDCHTSKVGDEEETGPFTFDFWSKGIDVILNALDNMEARLFMDSQCVANQKALVDAGTLGSKGNVQVVVPHQSESYGSSVDPPEPAIPVCTLKNFPYAISHTIQWGRDLFDGLFVRRPRQANKYAPILFEKGIYDFARVLEQELGDQAALEAATELSDDLIALSMVAGADDAAKKKHAIQWAIKLSKHLFHDAVLNLLLEHPADSLDEDGEKFWSGSRKMPRPLSYGVSFMNGDPQQSEINKNLADFVRSAARLRYESYTGIPKSPGDNVLLVSKQEVMEVFESENGWDESKEEASTDSKDSGSTTEPIGETIRRELHPLQSIEEAGLSELPLFDVAEFEKDDDSNDHIAFITAASNLRAICYGIPPVDSMETRKVAGRIVPAMITTTAFVSALSCIELVKLSAGKLALQRHRNAFINLALPFFAFTAPLPAEEIPGLRGKSHSMWDRITIKEGKKEANAGGLTLNRLLKKISKKVYEADPDAISISNISVGPIMIYANFLHEDDEILLDKSIWEVVQEAVIAGSEFDREFSRDPTSPTSFPVVSKEDAYLPFIDLTVTVEDLETGEEAELPPVRVLRRQTVPKPE
jgi:ubiquitin-activating enzyme E1